MKQVLIGSRYILNHRLGGGGTAEVFLARDEVLDRDVALKMLRKKYAENEEFVRRFRREARSAASLTHPHVVVVYDWGRSEDGAYYMAMEFAPGGSLKERILEDGPLAPRTAAEVASQIAQALGEAHGGGVIHRDVKPQNVLLTETGNAKVADFGIARAATATTTSRSELIMGTAAYMSPEQAKGEPVGPRSDLYSLGVVLYEMLTGEEPYGTEHPVKVAMKHVTEPPRSPRETNPEVPEEIDAITLRLLAKDPADRYGSAAELVGDLRRVGNRLDQTFADAEPTAANRAVLPALPVPASPGGDGSPGRPAVVYRRPFARLPLVQATALVALVVVLLGATSWGPWWGSREQARAQDVTSESLDGISESFEGGERASVPVETASDTENLPEDEGQQSPTTDTASPELSDDDFVSDDAVLEDEGQQSPTTDTASPELSDGDFVSDDAVLEDGGVYQDPEIDILEKWDTVLDATVGSEPERVDIPEVSGGSAEEAAQTLSGAGHVVAGTMARRSPEPSGTVVGTDLLVGSTVERGAAVLIVVSSGPASQDGRNGDEDAALASTPETSPATMQPSKMGKRDPKSLAAALTKGDPVSGPRPGKAVAYSSSGQALAN